ncbi:4'-phosphopantetheinyl transferase family protein [Rouxiella sp. Mn2063]|uniref:4'-phosphopantetheinyl transferase family protein n=1 Tax=Rouxiella sp. Mn2063 TaxID=3395262 RepID=UPI003BD634D6
MLNSFAPRFVSQLSEKEISGFSGVCYQCHYNDQQYTDADTSRLFGGRFDKYLERAVVKRKAEFVAGRYLAHQALTQLGAGNASVDVGAHRAPLWPDTFIGSISHSEGFVVCAVGNKNVIKGVGIDVERFIDAETAGKIINSVLTHSEFYFTGENIALDAEILTLIFSAKESLYKALHPHVGRYFDFKAAAINKIDIITNRFTIELVEELAPDLPIGTQFEGIFERDSQKVFTAIFW